MKLHLVLVALLRPALGAHEAVDAAELQLALQSDDGLKAWIESIAARRQLPKDTVRSNVQAMTYHLEPVGQDPVGKDPGSSATRAEHAKLERRQPVVYYDYPDVWSNERRNDDLTKHRLSMYHLICRREWNQPEGSPYTPSGGMRSFWRGGGGGCREDDGRVRIFCKLPREFGPPGWRPGYDRNVHESTITCQPGFVCVKFSAHNFLSRRAVWWGGCIQEKKTEQTGQVNNVPEFSEKVPCPIHPSTSSQWEVFGQTTDGLNVDWKLFTGRPKEQISYSRSPTFMFAKPVEWRGTDPDYEPWLKIARMGQPATIRLYSHLG